MESSKFYENAITSLKELQEKVNDIADSVTETTNQAFEQVDLCYQTIDDIREEIKEIVALTGKVVSCLESFKNIQKDVVSHLEPLKNTVQIIREENLKISERLRKLSLFAGFLSYLLFIALLYYLFNNGG